MKRRAPADPADDKHVGIVPAARLGVQLVPSLGEADARHAAPRVGDIAGGSPAVAADLVAPFPDVVHAVLAEAEDDIAVLGPEHPAHQVVGFLVVGAAGSFFDITVAAPVVLEVIKAPLGEPLGVFPFMLVAGHAAAAGLRAG